MRFDFATAARIIFAPGAIRDFPKIASEFGTRALLVTGRSTERATPLRDELQRIGIDCPFFPVEDEPTLHIIRKGVQAARDRCHFVIGFGGGSAIDAAKAIAALAPNSGEPLDYLEIIGRGRSLEHSPLPFLAIPTTAGSGAEVTRNAVLGSPEHGVKASLRSPLMLAKLALVDPDLTINLQPEVTARTGLDALTQVIEPFVSNRANPFTDLFCVEGMRCVAASLRNAYRDGGDRDARESMSFASLLGGLALANAGLGVVHGFAAPLGGMLHAPHGSLCAAVLPHGVAMNVRVLRDRGAQCQALQKYDEAARILTGNAQAKAEDGTAWVAAVCRDLGVQPLRAFGLKPEQIPVLVEKAANANSMKSNPIQLTPDELAEIAERAL